MAIGRIPLSPRYGNDQPFSLDVNFWLDAAKTEPLVLSSASAWLAGPSNLTLTVTNGRIVLSNNTAGLRVAQEDMETLAPGTYQIEVQATDTTGGVRQIRGTITIEAGLGDA